MTETDVWNVLKNSDKPIIIYGMGDGADKILKVFERYRIQISGFFASDEFVRGHSFHGFKVRTYAETCEMFDDFIIVVAFATSLPDVIDKITDLAERHELYIPDVPVAGSDLFNLEFYHNNRRLIETARALLADNESERIFDNIIRYKLSGKIEFLLSSQSSKHDVYTNLLNCVNYHSYVDLGAYTGDTVREILGFAPHLRHVTAFEPDIKNFKKLSAYLEEIPNSRAYNLAAWHAKTSLPFDTRGGRNSRIGGGSRIIEADTVDNIIGDSEVDFIKYDVEGAEYEALSGSVRTIKKYSPDLAVSLYHRSDDIFKLILHVHDLNPNYGLYIRRFPYFPAWDLNLYALST